MKIAEIPFSKVIGIGLCKYRKGLNVQNTDTTLTPISLGRIEYRNCEYFSIDEER